MANKATAQEYGTRKRRRRFTTMDIPEDRAEEVRRLMERLDMKDNEVLNEKQGDGKFEYEVTGVSDHRINADGSFTWTVHFKGWQGGWEVHDSECNCEAFIQQYLADNVPEVRTVFGLCRVSSKNQTGPTHVSLAAQEARIRQTAKAIELGPEEILRVRIFSIAASAYKSIPKKLQYIADHARPRDILVTYNVDRLSRNIIKFLDLLESMDANGVLIYAQDENMWYHNVKLDFLRRILDAQTEGAYIGKRVKMSIEHRRNRGDHIGSVPYGFRTVRDPDTQIVRKVPNRDEQGIIDRIKVSTMKRRRGCTFRDTCQQVAEQLNQEGVYKRGKPWTATMVIYVRDHN